MNSHSKEIFPKTSTCGYLQEVGSWEIAIEVPEERSPTSLNGFAQRMVDCFLQSFGPCSRAVSGYYDIMSVDDQGNVAEVREGETRSFETKDRERLLQELMRPVSESQGSYFTWIVLSCGLLVFVPTADERFAEMWVPKGGEFHFGYDLQYDQEGKLVPAIADARFIALIDVWVERTIDPDSLEWRDNHEAAQRNQPLLEKALQQWERSVGEPIVEWESRWYRDQIARHGFKAV